MIDYSDVEKVLEQCFKEIEASSRERYDAEKADRTAALFLSAQMKLSFLIEEVELRAKQSKNEVSRIEGEKYFEVKTTSSDKKITENMMTAQLAMHPDIVSAKAECAREEASLKKWVFVMNTLKDGHIFFRGASKNKQWSE
jgi:hypothetical protein